MLQSTPVLARIRKAVTNRVLTELKTRAKDDADYASFWENFGPLLKEGMWEDADHRKDLAPLLRFNSSAIDGLTSLPAYVERMKPRQPAIYVLAGDSVEALKKSAQLEGFRARGLEVLLLADPIDAFWPERMAEFDGKPIRSVTQAATDLATFPLEGAAVAPDAAALITALKSALGDAVSDVQATDRLVDSAVVLAPGAHAPDLQMQRLLRRSGRQSFAAAPVLEVNPRHALIGALIARQASGAAIAEQADMLLDLARVQDGDLPRDPAMFARRIEAALAAAFG